MDENQGGYEVTISTEDEAWAFLERAITQEFGDKFHGVKFDNWPTIEIKLEGERWDSSLTARNMAGLIEIQNFLYKSLALVLYDSTNTKILHPREKKSVEISFKLSQGSALIEVNLNPAFVEVCKTMSSTMSPTMIGLTIVGLALAWGGTAVLKAWLQHRKDIQTAKIAEESRQFAAEQETKRMEIFAKAISANPKLDVIKQQSEEMYANLIKGVADADKVSIAGHREIPGVILEKLARNPRAKKTEERLDGNYRILKVDSSDADSFKVHVINTETHEGFPATIENDWLYRMEKKREKLQQAEWGRQEIFLKINAKRIRGEISGAVITEVDDPILAVEE